jgi:DNA-binding MarR family transcriptional regulator
MSRDNVFMSRNSRAKNTVRADHVDEIVQQWNQERPDVDVSGMTVIGRLARLEKVIRPRLDAVFAEHDLESWEFDVLATLVRNGEPNQLTPGELLKSMMITSGAMTNRIDRLEQRGFVKRTKSPADGRQVLVTLTPRGRKKLDAAFIDHAANELAIIDTLDIDQRRQLVDLLRDLHHHIVDHPATKEAEEL